jgi:hypothetical protein
MYQHLSKVANDAVNRRDFDTYHEARAKMEEMDDDSKAALRFFKRGGVPTVTERAVGKLENMADHIISVRDNINEAVIARLEKDEKGSGNHSEAEQPKPNLEDKMNAIADHILDFGENISDTVHAGAEIIADRHGREIPAEIGGSTVTWAEMNPFRSPFKNGKLR